MFFLLRNPDIQTKDMQDKAHIETLSRTQTINHTERPPTKSPDSDLLWKQYNLHIDLYKHYLDLLLKYNTFYYLITGGIVSFYLASENKNAMRFALLLPITVSMFFSFLSLYAAYGMRLVVYEVNTIRNELGLKVSPDLGFLTFLLIICGLMFVIIELGLITLFALRL